ncbi:uncharacterized protein [Diadema antillarum]|uniref:uncharacterized protein n=1 Tax=Diadema antillarum TaxID=105358 RepID=UPI003A860951
MRNHRDPQKHEVFPFDETVTKRRAILNELLDRGKTAVARLQADKQKRKRETAKPSSVITLGEDKKIAVAFQNKPNGEVYERSGKFSHTLGHEPIRDMALLTKDTIIVLNNRGDFAAHLFNQSKYTKTVLKTHDANTATPNSVAIDHNGKILLLYRSHLDLLSKDGGTLGTMSLDLKHQPSQLRVGQSPDGRTTVVLLRDGETLRLLHLDLSEKKIVEEQHLPCHQPDTRRFGTLDREGHCFIADLRNKGSITIKKYWTDSFLYCEEIATDLEMKVGEEESIILSAPDPTCLILCTPREIYVFSEKDDDESSFS